MREHMTQQLSDRRRAVLRQASAALRGKLVSLWQLASEGGESVAQVASGPIPAHDMGGFDVAAALRAWGLVPGEESAWLFCRLDAERWHGARVRADVPAPPPAGVERRSPERLTLELASLSLGALERMWATTDQATIYLCAARAMLDNCMGRVCGADGLSTTSRAHLLADLAGVAEAIDGALKAA
jgi:hypothetical protein